MPLSPMVLMKRRQIRGVFQREVLNMSNDQLQKVLIRCITNMVNVDGEEDLFENERQVQRVKAIMRLYLLTDNN